MILVVIGSSHYSPQMHRRIPLGPWTLARANRVLREVGPAEEPLESWLCGDGSRECDDECTSAEAR
jgi:hypothetical protein